MSDKSQSSTIKQTTVSGDTLSKIIRDNKSKYPGLTVDQLLVANKVKLSVDNKKIVQYLDYDVPKSSLSGNKMVYKTVTLDYSKGNSGPYYYDEDGKRNSRYNKEPINKGEKIRVLNTKFINDTYLSQVVTNFNSYTLWINSKDLQGLTEDNAVSDYLSLKNVNDILVKDLVLIIPIVVENKSTYSTSGNTLLKSPSRNINILGTSKLKGKKEELNCFFQRIVSGEIKDVCYLPVIPQEFSDNNSPTFNSVAMMGRSVEYQIYNSTSRSVSFSLQLHEEIAPDSGTTDSRDYNYVHNLVGLIESCCYPDYDSQGTVNHPPEVLFSIGDQFRVRGVLESCGATWSTPYIDSQYVNCNLSLTIKETTGPYSSEEIRIMKGLRV